jgi:prolyl-tRNA editing enzyme YbaK/EbsC (Cys-tRNA(Pro) deacylase)
MIQDFITSNELNAQILKFHSDVSVDKALSVAKLNISAYAKASPFVNEKMDFFVVLSIASEKVNIEIAEDLFDENLEEIDANEVLKLTGFEKNNFPPISIFGAKSVFTKEAKKQKKLIFELSSREYLVIDIPSIEKSQELSDYFFEEK